MFSAEQPQLTPDCLLCRVGFPVCVLLPGILRGLKMKTGFNSAEMFRKYLWYLLRERKFDTEAVNDIVQLKSALQLSDEEVSHAMSTCSVQIDLLANTCIACKAQLCLLPACQELQV